MWTCINVPDASTVNMTIELAQPSCSTGELGTKPEGTEGNDRCEPG